MASLFQTMFVPLSSSPTFPHDPKALPPISTLADTSPCLNRGGPDEANVGQRDGAPTPAPAAKGSSWLPRGLFAPSQLQAMFGSRRPADDVERQQSPEPVSPKTGPRASIESLRESLEALQSPLAGRFPQMQTPCHALPEHAPARAPIDSMVSRSNSKTKGPFKPQKTSRGTSGWQLRQFAEATLGSGSLRKAVKLPEGEDINEWLAVNVVDFYNQINLLYGSITEFCSPQTCPEMKATDEFEYLWQDSENFKRPTKMPAPEYIEHLMAWCQSNIDNEQLFPSRIGVAFPKTFPALVRQMFKRLYRVYAHIYCHHYPVVIQLGLEPHLNTSFKHYVLFVDEHQLATGKDFWGPLGDLVESMLRSD